MAAGIPSVLCVSLSIEADVTGKTKRKTACRRRIRHMKTERSSQAVLDRFVLEWGRMSSNWGINRTMAQIHALLFMSSKPLTMDEICERLAISRGNASMSLRNLMDWGVIKRYRHKGERHD